MTIALEDSDVATAAGQLHRGGQTGQTRTDYDDSVGVSVHGAHHAVRSTRAGSVLLIGLEHHGQQLPAAAKVNPVDRRASAGQ
jgi:hypothetical protein